MLSRILWSIVLHTNLFCAASYLDHFTQVFVKLDESEAATSRVPDPDGTFVQQIHECAQECFFEKYFCNAFIVTPHHECITYAKPHPAIYPYQDSSDYPMIAFYNIKEPRKFDLVKEFSRNIESREEWIDHIQQGYSCSVKCYEPFLRGCWSSAVNGKPASVVDIIEEDTGDIIERDTGDFIEENDTGGPKAKRRKISRHSIHEEISVDHKIPGHSITDEILVGLKSWPESSEFLDIIALAFLDIFSHSIGRDLNSGEDFTTVFDPIKKSLFIHAKDFYLFIVSYGNGDYAMIQHGSGLPNNQPLIYLTDSTQDSQFESAWEMFEGAMNLLGHQPPILEKLFFKLIYNNDHGNTEAVLAVILGAINILREPLPRYQNIYDRTYEDMRKCVTDMVPFVLSKVYGKDIRSNIARSRLLESSVKNLFDRSTIDIITGT